MHATTLPSLDFWFDFSSPFSHLSVMRIAPLAERARVAVRWKPFLLGPVFEALGWQAPPLIAQPVKGAHMWRDMERQAERLGVAYRRPSEFPRVSVLGTRVALAAQDERWVGAFCAALSHAHWARDERPGDEAVVRAALHAAGIGPGEPADAWIARAGHPDTKAALFARGDEARRLGLFGAPNFLVDGELFWGDDRLEAALDWARRHEPVPALPPLTLR